MPNAHGVSGVRLKLQMKKLKLEAHEVALESLTSHKTIERLLDDDAEKVSRLAIERIADAVGLTVEQLTTAPAVK